MFLATSVDNPQSAPEPPLWFVCCGSLEPVAMLHHRPIAPGLIVLMAQMGSFVPADVAVIPVRDRLLSRIGTGDDMENNVSTFLMEMREVSQVCTNKMSC